MVLKFISRLPNAARQVRLFRGVDALPLCLAEGARPGACVFIACDPCTEVLAFMLAEVYRGWAMQEEVSELRSELMRNCLTEAASMADSIGGTVDYLPDGIDRFRAFVLQLLSRHADCSANFSSMGLHRFRSGRVATRTDCCG